MSEDKKFDFPLKSMFFGGKVIMGVVLPPDAKMSIRFQMNLARMEPCYVNLIIYQSKSDEEGNVFWKTAKAHEDMRQYILKKAKDVTHLFLLDHDIDAPPEIIPVMLIYDADIVYHSYPKLGTENKTKRGMGCILIRANVLERFTFTERMTPNGKVPDSKVFWKWALVQKDLKIVELDDTFELIHYDYKQED